MAEILGTWSACGGCLSALRAGSRRCGGYGRKRRPCPTTKYDTYGRSDRHSGQPHESERTCNGEADRVVRKEPYRSRARSLSRCRTPCLSGIYSAPRLYVDEYRSPSQGAYGALSTSCERRDCKSGGDQDLLR